ncbi:MAG: DUF4261 domain-containing protein [Myxococcota bacterium]
MTEDAFARTYGVELLCESSPNIEKAALLEAVKRYCPDAKLLDPNPATPLLALVHPKHHVRLADAVVPAQTLIAQADKPLKRETCEQALNQTWEFADARAKVEISTTSVLVTDVMSSSLEYRQRLALFHDCLRGVLDYVPCAAIHWRPSGRIVDPSAWRRDYDAGDPAQRFFAGAVNVRLFNVQNEAGKSPGELVMDTLGLAALGLVDLQCHFQGLDPGDVARVLYNTAWYLFCEGDVIADGHTVQGVRAGSKWRCQHEKSLVGPERVVLDLNPGPAHATGSRAN